MTALAGGLVVVTGAGGGIGAAIARALVAEGARVLAVGRRDAPLAPLVTEGRGAVCALAADVASPDGRAAVVHRATRAEAPLVAVVHAAGVPGFGLFEHADEDALRAQVEVGLLAPLLLTRALLPALQARDDTAVLAIGSTFGSLGFPGFAAYGAAKAGLRGAFEALARERRGRPPRFLHLAARATDTALNAGPVQALNRELGVAVDPPHRVADAAVRALRQGRARGQIGWPESLFVRLNGLLPALVDRALARQLPVVRRHAGEVAAASATPRVDSRSPS